MKLINAIRMGGMEVLPLVEGGKGISISNGLSSGNWAFTGGVGTFSAVNADSFDERGQRIAQVYRGRTRRERHEELVGLRAFDGLTLCFRQRERHVGGARKQRYNAERGNAEHSDNAMSREGGRRTIHGVSGARESSGAQACAPVPALRGDLNQEASEAKVWRWRCAHGGGWLATCRRR